MDYQDLVIERRNKVTILRLNRPDKHNALSRRLAGELIHALDELEADDGANAVLLIGSGERAFCAGADMAEAMSKGWDSGVTSVTPADALARTLRFVKPIIAAVNGYAYGGGAVLAINCDVRIASPTTRFRFMGVEYGLVVGAGQLPRIIGAPIAKELVFTARTVDAAEADRIGLVNRVVPAEALEEEALQMAQVIAAHDPSAVRASKEVIDLATDNVAAIEREINVKPTAPAVGGAPTAFPGRY